MSFEQNPFNLQKYGLSKSPEVEAAAKITEVRTGEPVPDDPASRIQNYLNRFKEITERPDPVEREKGIDAIKRVLHNKFVIKKDKIPESYYDSIKLKHRKEGHGDIEIPEDLRQELAGTIVAEQESSLDNWVDYLASDDAKYPDALKYWTMRSVLKMGRYDKGKKKFTERYGGAVSPFPDINREALAYIIDAVEKKYEGKSISFPYDIQDEEKKEFDKFLQGENFPKLYAWAIDKINPVSEELLKITDGEWRPYPKGSDHMSLAESLGGKGTGWCIAGEATAKRYLQGSAGIQGNDLEVFYSLDEEGQPTIPRVVVVSANNKISEVRGVAKEENLDPHIGAVVQAKLAQLPDGKAYEKKAGDMKHLTDLEDKVKNGEILDKADLRFLHEFDAPIEGFGYKRDPRIDELKSKRNKREDLCMIFNCTEEELEEKERFTLHDIPTFLKLPSATVLKDKKNGYKFDWTWEQEYREGRSIEDFALTDKDLQDMGLSDPEKRKELLQEIAKGKEHKELESVAKVFDIGDVIAQKRKENPNHPNYLTTKEVFEAIDEAGYRPATIEELLAFGKQSWKPDVDSKTLTDEEKLLQRVNAPYIYALSSPFPPSGGNRVVPSLGWNGVKRDLDGGDLGYDWNGYSQFLVFRKFSSI